MKRDAHYERLRVGGEAVRREVNPNPNPNPNPNLNPNPNPNPNPNLRVGGEAVRGEGGEEHRVEPVEEQQEERRPEALGRAC